MIKRATNEATGVDLLEAGLSGQSSKKAFPATRLFPLG